jgi:hypothetical protein
MSTRSKAMLGIHHQPAMKYHKMKIKSSFYQSTDETDYTPRDRGYYKDKDTHLWCVSVLKDGVPYVLPDRFSTKKDAADLYFTLKEMNCTNITTTKEYVDG